MAEQAIFQEQAFKTKPKRKKNKNGSLLFFIIPALIFVLIFSYAPMFGLVMAFKKGIDFTQYSNPFIAILMGENAGFTQFGLLFSNPVFLSALRNTLFISILKIVVVFPIPIFLAILITEVKNHKAKNVVQSISYLPHFLSWAIAATIFISMLQVEQGSLNIILKALGMGEVDVSNPNQFPFIMVWSSAWKDVGWSTVVYIAAISAIDQAQYEAARIDGATKFQEIRYITLPAIASTIVVLLILRISHIMDAGFEQVYAMLTPTAESTGQIIGTMIYDISIKQGGQYEFTTAAGLLNSSISLFLILGGNFLSKKIFKRGIF